MQTDKVDDGAMLHFVRGDATGLMIPAHVDALREGGVAFLTAAFRAFGSLSSDNEVTRITRLDVCAGGSTGHKYFLSVDYARPDPGLHRDLFVKFSRHFTDPHFDRRRFELESEIRLAALSRHPAFPITVPAAAFADNHGASGTGLLICEVIRFGAGAIEPLHHKCMDYELDDPLTYYRAILTAFARLAAAHKAGALSPQVDHLFPFDAASAASEDPIRSNEGELRQLVADYADFAARCPHLLPANITAPAFIARLEEQAVRFLRHEATVKHYLYADRDYIALGHFNGHIDNAWFWRDGMGALQCGVFDWQRARQMNLGVALWGCLSGAGLDIWNDHLDDLLRMFVEELHAHGGPLLDVIELRLHLHLYMATMGLAAVLATPAMLLARLPKAIDAKGPRDPIIVGHEQMRGYLNAFTTFLNLWEADDFGASLDRVLERAGLRP